MPTIKEIKGEATKHYSSLHRQFLHETGFYITKLFLYTPLTPNQITIIWFIMQLAALPLVLKGTYWSILLGTILFQFAIIIDCVDGQVARFRKTSSLMGTYLDQFVHNITNPAFLLCLSIAVWKNTGTIWYLYAGIAGVLSFWHTRLLTLNPLWFREEHRALLGKYFDNFAMRKHFIWIYDSLKIEYPLNFLFFGVLLGFANIMVVAYAAMYFIDFVKRTIFQFKKVHDADREIGPGAKGGLW